VNAGSVLTLSLAGGALFVQRLRALAVAQLAALLGSLATPSDLALTFGRHRAPIYMAPP